VHPESAVSSILTVFVDDLDERVTGIAARRRRAGEAGDL